MSTITIYGIPNCDTTIKAINLLNKQQVKYVFHDYKQVGITAKQLKQWCDKAGWEKVFNKRSTTWRELPEKEQSKVKDQSSAIAIMLEHNSIIKRPIIEKDDKLVIGFDEKSILYL